MCSEVELKGSETFLNQYFKSRNELSKLDEEKARSQRDKQLRALGNLVVKISCEIVNRFFF